MTNLDIVKSYVTELWDTKNINAIDTYFDAHAVIHSPVETTQGTDKMKAIISAWYTGFPNLKVYWEHFICEDNKVVGIWRAEGSNEGEFLGYPASHKPVKYSGATAHILDNEKIIEYWAFVDMQTVMKQIT